MFVRKASNAPLGIWSQGHSPVYVMLNKQQQWHEQLE